MSSRGVNKVILIGNLGNDPEVRFTPGGAAIANLSIATSESWKDRNTGETQEKTEWHRVVIFGKLAEIAQQYLRKGSKVYLEGKLQTRKWQDQQGQDRYSTEVVVDSFTGQMQMLDGRPEGAGAENYRPNQSQPSQQHAPAQPAASPNYGQQTPVNPAQQQPAVAAAPAQHYAQAPAQGQRQGQPQGQPQRQPQGQPQKQPDGFDSFDDDIPF